MEKLKKVIEQYGRWAALTTYTARIEMNSSTDFSQSLENEKALLETISKEICKANNIMLDPTANMNSVLRTAFKTLGYTNNEVVTKISSALSTIGQYMGELRNEIGTTSHGRTLEELNDRNSKVDELTKEFLIDATEIVACFLIRTFEKEQPRLKSDTVEGSPIYKDNEAFNVSWDEIYGEFQMGDYSYTASEILYYVDYQSYLAENRIFMESKEGEQDDD